MVPRVDFGRVLGAFGEGLGRVLEGFGEILGEHPHPAGCSARSIADTPPYLDYSNAFFFFFEL